MHTGLFSPQKIATIQNKSLAVA